MHLQTKLRHKESVTQQWSIVGLLWRCISRLNYGKMYGVAQLYIDFVYIRTYEDALLNF